MTAWKSYWQFYRKAGTIYTNQSSILHRFYEKVLSEGRTPNPISALLNAKYFELSREDITLHRSPGGKVSVFGDSWDIRPPQIDTVDQAAVGDQPTPDADAPYRHEPT